MANKSSGGSRVKTTRFSKRIVVFCIFFISVYTILQVILSYEARIELSPVLTTSVYAFFGTELGLCAMTKVCDSVKDIKKPSSKTNDENSVG